MSKSSRQEPPEAGSLAFTFVAFGAGLYRPRISGGPVAAHRSLGHGGRSVRGRRPGLCLLGVLYCSLARRAVGAVISTKTEAQKTEARELAGARLDEAATDREDVLALTLISVVVGLVLAVGYHLLSTWFQGWASKRRATLTPSIVILAVSCSAGPDRSHLGGAGPMGAARLPRVVYRLYRCVHPAHGLLPVRLCQAPYRAA